MGRVMVGAALLAAGLLAGCASQAPDPMPLASTMPTGNAPAPTPAGFISFCMRFATQCETAHGLATSVTLTDQAWRSLTRINRDVNDSIWPESDAEHYGRAEFWTIPTDGYGDCDDYAVTKRKALMDAGFPAPALRLAVVDAPGAGRHAVLTIATDKGDLVLDNLRNEIMPWNATGFTWIERQDASNPIKWVSLRSVFVAQQNGLPMANTGAAPQTSDASSTELKTALALPTGASASAKSAESKQMATR